MERFLHLERLELQHHLAYTALCIERILKNAREQHVSTWVRIALKARQFNIFWGQQYLQALAYAKHLHTMKERGENELGGNSQVHGDTELEMKLI